MSQQTSQVQKLAEDHWDYTSSIANTTLTNMTKITPAERKRILTFAKQFYVSAFIHGHKHAMEEKTQ
jgi:cytolysin (calcineurin-like family phosphatase)